MAVIIAPMADIVSRSGPVFEAMPGLVTDLGGFPIRRLLPRSRRRLVGPWCFLDAFGPVDLSASGGMNVGAHPHIGIQTVTWLFDGKVRHDDSAGGAGLAEPGTLNVMTAGRGIAHAEVSEAPGAGRLWGAQLWVALPDATRDADPRFHQHRDLPRLDLDGGSALVFMGALGGVEAPAKTFSPIAGAEVRAARGATLAIPLDRAFEHAAVLVEGEASIHDRPLSPHTLYDLGAGRSELIVTAGDAPARLLLIGGAPFDEEILMWWNFVARKPDEIAKAREDWERGRRFGDVAHPGPRIPAPPYVARPVPSRR